MFAYSMRVGEGWQSFHQALPPTRVWGYQVPPGSPTGQYYPGPTFVAHYNEPMMVRFYNQLPKDHRGFGIPSISTHLHNGHTASESDGYPGNFFDSGTYWDNLYPNVLNGFTANPDARDARDAMGTLWYHDHRQDFTAQNVYSGLVGGYLLFD